MTRRKLVAHSCRVEGPTGSERLVVKMDDKGRRNPLSTGTGQTSIRWREDEGPKERVTSLGRRDIEVWREREIIRTGNPPFGRVAERVIFFVCIFVLVCVICR